MKPFGNRSAGGDGASEQQEDVGRRNPKARERGRMRRRLRRQHRVREALLLDLGALVFELHRQGRREPELLQAKAAELTAVDEELRSLTGALDTGPEAPALVAPGIAGSCEKCGGLITSDARFCPTCGAAATPALGADRPEARDVPPGLDEAVAVGTPAVADAPDEQEPPEPPSQPEPPLADVEEVSEEGAAADEGPAAEEEAVTEEDAAVADPGQPSLAEETPLAEHQTSAVEGELPEVEESVTVIGREPVADEADAAAEEAAGPPPGAEAEPEPEPEAAQSPPDVEPAPAQRDEPEPAPDQAATAEDSEREEAPAGPAVPGAQDEGAQPPPGGLLDDVGKAVGAGMRRGRAWLERRRAQG